MNITLYDASMAVRGSTVALYDYAYYLKHMYGHKCDILYNINHPANNNEVVKKFLKEFNVDHFNNASEIDGILSKNKSEIFFMIKRGFKDDVISSFCKNLVMAIGLVNKEDVHGDKFAFCSDWLKNAAGNIAGAVPHMINLPDVEGDLRSELNIPRDAIVFGRNGGTETFDLYFVREAISNALKVRNNLYFIFQYTDKFIDHERVIFLPSSPDLEYKVKFINTADACLHARQAGESFGLTCGEFSVKNKPVFTWYGSPERSHIEILGDKGVYYNDYEQIYNMLIKFKPNPNVDWNCYRNFLPKPVMKRFVDYYLE